MVDNAAMRTVKCPACGGKTKRNGKTKAGAQRWRCTSCGASTTQRYSNKASMLALFLDWLLSKRTQAQMGMPARTFRSLTSEFWSLWPTAPLCDEAHHVVHVDGIWLKRSCVILIACTEGHVVGWHLARSESSQAWAALMARIAPPDVVVADGSGGFERARRAVWPETKVQRCTFHAFEQVKRCTTTRPRTQAGVDLYAMAKGLLKVGTPDAAAEWLAGYAKWCSDYEGFLEEREVVDGRPRYKHERLRKARRGLTKLCREGGPVHLPRRGARRRRRRPRDQQPHRGRREPPDQGDAQRAQGHEAGPHGQGGVLVLQQQAGGAGVPSTGACGVPDRRGHSRAAPDSSRGQRERRGRRTMGRGC